MAAVIPEMASVQPLLTALRRLPVLYVLLLLTPAHAQTLGGAAAFNFLKLPASPVLTAAGGINVSHTAQDVGFALQNPALLQPSHHAQAGLAFTDLFAGISGLNLAGAYHDPKRETTFGGNLFYLNYGAIQQTDAAGNIGGHFNASDYAVQFSASRAYLQRWRYGFTAKWIHSRYGQYRSSALAADVGVLYRDSAAGLSLSVLARNMGAQFTSYETTREDLPFDLQAGFTKKLEKAPLAFSVTAFSWHRFNLLYNDTVFNAGSNWSSQASFAKKLLTHFVLATHISIGTHIEATIGYNFLRRSELNLGTQGNGLTGFSAGFSARFEKLHVSYARSAYQRARAYQQLGINLMLDRLFGLGQL